MFIYKLSSFIDKYDRYWYGRLIALKAAYITVGVFIANLLLHPTSPTLTMLLSAVGIIIIEMPTINDLNKKDNLFLGFVILINLTVAIFSSVSFLQLPFIIVIAAWAYLLYFALRKKPELFTIVSALLMLATIAQEGNNTGNYFAIWDQALFILEFSLICFWLHKLFPFLYHYIWLSSFMRSLETMSEMINNADKKSSLYLRQHSLISLSSMQLLQKKSYFHLLSIIHGNLANYHYFLYNHIVNDGDKYNLQEIADDFSVLLESIKTLKACVIPQDLCRSKFEFHEQNFNTLITTWNELCVHVNR